MTEAVVSLLSLQFSYGATDEEACFVAGISRQTLNQYCKKHPEFRDRKQSIKGMVRLRAKMKINQTILDGGGDEMTERDRAALANAWKVLEKSDPEYKPDPVGANTGTQILINNASLNPREKLKTMTDAQLLEIAQRAKSK